MIILSYLQGTKGRIFCILSQILFESIFPNPGRHHTALAKKPRRSVCSFGGASIVEIVTSYFLIGQIRPLQADLRKQKRYQKPPIRLVDGVESPITPMFTNVGVITPLVLTDSLCVRCTCKRRCCNPPPLLAVTYVMLPVEIRSRVTYIKGYRPNSLMLAYKGTPQTGAAIIAF